MAKDSNIEWTNHTFNPWIGCTKISPACDNCYAAEWDKRYEGGQHWGAKAPRRKTSVKNWNNPLRWNKEAQQAGTRYRVFCASLADVFDNQVPQEWRDELWDLIKKTPYLDWLLLTKRPQNILKMLPKDWGAGYPNVWLGTTVENQTVADKNIPHLLRVPAKIRFLSCEPLLGPIRLWTHEDGDLYGPAVVYYGSDTGIFNDESPEGWDSSQVEIDWVIAGGESGSHYRESDPDWYRSLRDQCQTADVPFLFKQWGGASQKIIKEKGRLLDGELWDQYPKESIYVTN